MAASKRTTARTPARRTTPVPKAKAVKPFEQLSEIDDDGYVDVLIFGEPFTIDTDVNGWALLLAASNDWGAFAKLVHGIIKVTPANGESIEVARATERRRFDDLLMSQKKFGIEQVMELVNDLTAISAGNEL